MQPILRLHSICIYSNFIYFILFFIPYLLSSQGKRDYIWLLGGSRQPTIDTNFQGFQLDFNNKPLSISIKDRPPPIIRQNNASICDKDGNLLMFTAGCYISDRLHRPMPNGTINEGFAWDFNCKYGDYSVFNGTLILPSNIGNNKYIVLHKFEKFGVDSTGRVGVIKLLYSIVDMNQNNGFGDLITKNNIAIEKPLSYSELSATRHSNNVDWWIVVPDESKNYYYKLKLNGEKVEFVDEQKIGREFMDYGGGQSCFSPDGTRYARMTMQDGLYLFDFERSTGKLSNFRHHLTGLENPDYSTGVAFSPNGRYIYITTQVDLYQLDSEASNLSSSLIHIDTWDGYADEDIWAAQFSHMMLAPDCKIYLRTRTSNKVMHVIHSPNEKGKACNFEQHGIHLPAWNHASIPNFVNYRLGYEPVCDSTLNMTWNIDIKDIERQLICYPQPVISELNIELWDRNQTISSLYICNLQGQTVVHKDYSEKYYKTKLNVHNLESGIYFIHLKDYSGVSYTAKFIKVE